MVSSQSLISRGVIVSLRMVRGMTSRPPWWDTGGSGVGGVGFFLFTIHSLFIHNSAYLGITQLTKTQREKSFDFRQKVEYNMYAES